MRQCRPVFAASAGPPNIAPPCISHHLTQPGIRRRSNPVSEPLADAGGYVPKSARGAVRHGLMQHVDVARTLAGLGKADLGSDADGLDVWNVVIEGAASPRTEVPLNVDTSEKQMNYSSLIQEHRCLLCTTVHSCRHTHAHLESGSLVLCLDATHARTYAQTHKRTNTQSRAQLHKCTNAQTHA